MLTHKRKGTTTTSEPSKRITIPISTVTLLSVTEEPIEAKTNNVKHPFEPEAKIYDQEDWNILMKREEKYFCRPTYLLNNQIISKNYLMVIEWLFEMGYKLQMSRTNLYLALEILHQFLCKLVVPIKKLQDYGIVALVIANKLQNESLALDEYTGLMNYDNLLNEKQLLQERNKIESLMLNTLKFTLRYVTSFDWLQMLYCKIFNVADFANLAHQLRTTDHQLVWIRTCFLLDLSKIDVAVTCSPLHLATSALYVGLFGKQAKYADLDQQWLAMICQLSGKTSDELLLCVNRHRLYLEYWWKEIEYLEAHTRFLSSKSDICWFDDLTLVYSDVASEMPKFWDEQDKL